MNVVDLANRLQDGSQSNAALDLLYQVLFDRDELLIDQLAALISVPAHIQNSHQFASILAEYNSDKFIVPLTTAIKQSGPGSAYLANYLYALVSVVNSHEQAQDFDDEFTDLLGTYLLSSGGGEIAWKAADILSWNRNPRALVILLRGAKDLSLFEMARHACIRGVVNHFPTDAPDLLAQLKHDDCEEIRDYVISAQTWLASR